MYQMETVEVVIKIPKRSYESIISYKGKCLGLCDNAVKVGTVLPKGHGRLIDASQMFTVTECRPDGTEFTYVPYTSIENAEAVIKADKEVEDEGSGV